MFWMIQIAQLAIAQTGDGQDGGQGGAAGGSLWSMAPLLLMFGVIYLLLIAPARKQRRQHQEMLSALKKDDEVVTNGGIYGRIVSIDERVVTLEIADRVKIRILRDRISGRWQAGDSSTQK